MHDPVAIALKWTAIRMLSLCVLTTARIGAVHRIASERPGPVDHADTRSRHGLRIESGSLLHRTLQIGDASVNTRHHQAIRDVAPALRASAWAEDGVIEGAERQDPGTAWMLAVQWHPEDDVEGALFRGFADAVA